MGMACVVAATSCTSKSVAIDKHSISSPASDSYLAPAFGKQSVHHNKYHDEAGSYQKYRPRTVADNLKYSIFRERDRTITITRQHRIWAWHASLQLSQNPLRCCDRQTFNLIARIRLVFGAGVLKRIRSP